MAAANGDSRVPGKILVAVDLSKHSEKVVQVASDLAKGLGEGVTLLYVVTASPDLSPWTSLWVPPAQSLPPPTEASEPTDSAPSTREALIEQVRLFQSRGVRAGLQVVTGLDPAHEILRVAEEGRYRLIVMGTHGRSGIEHWLMGSIAERTLRRAPCPVVTVGPRVSEPLSPQGTGGAT